MDRWPNARFSNVYGPAEANQCTYYHVPAHDKGSTEPIPIGKVWDNAEGLIVDTDDAVVPTGTPGELLDSSADDDDGLLGTAGPEQDGVLRPGAVPRFSEALLPHR